MPKGPITWTDDDVMAEVERLQARIEKLEAVVAAVKVLTGPTHSSIQSAYHDEELVLLEALAALGEDKNEGLEEYFEGTPEYMRNDSYAIDE